MELESALSHIDAGWSRSGRGRGRAGSGGAAVGVVGVGRRGYRRLEGDRGQVTVQYGCSSMRAAAV